MNNEIGKLLTSSIEVKVHKFEETKFVVSLNVYLIPKSEDFKFTSISDVFICNNQIFQTQINPKIIPVILENGIFRYEFVEINHSIIFNNIYCEGSYKSIEDFNTVYSDKPLLIRCRLHKETNPYKDELENSFIEDIIGLTVRIE